MKPAKRVLTVLLALSLTLILAACGKKEEWNITGKWRYMEEDAEGLLTGIELEITSFDLETKTIEGDYHIYWVENHLLGGEPYQKEIESFIYDSAGIRLDEEENILKIGVLNGKTDFEDKNNLLVFQPDGNGDYTVTARFYFTANYFFDYVPMERDYS